MKRFLRYHFVALALLSFCTQEAAAQTIAYSADDGSQSSYTWGTSKKENYDVAIHIIDTTLVGKTIQSVSVPISATMGTSNWSVWLSKIS